jgi:integrase
MGREFTRHTTKYPGVYYIDSSTNGRKDKTYYIRFRDENNKDTELKLGKHSENIGINDCKKRRDEILTRIRLGEDLSNILVKKKRSGYLLDDLAKQYFEYREIHNNSEYSLKNDRYRYQKHIEIFLGNKDLQFITSKDIEKIQGIKIKELAPKTVSHITNLISAIFNYAIQNDYFKGQNPVAKIKKLKIDNKRERYLSTEEIKLLLNEVKDNQLVFLFCLIAFSTGARLRTILSIQKKHIDLNTRILTLRDFKNSSWYKGFLSQTIIDILEPILIKLNMNDYILQINNKPISNRQIRDRLKPILDELFNKGLDKDDRRNRTVIHTFRHSFASNLAINSTPIYTIQKLLNHQDVTTTTRYAKLDPKNGQDMVDDIMGKIL